MQQYTLQITTRRDSSATLFLPPTSHVRCGHKGLGRGAEIARPDIARPENAAPYRNGGHRKTCFSVRVDAHYKFMFDSGVLYELLVGFMFVSSSFYF